MLYVFIEYTNIYQHTDSIKEKQVMSALKPVLKVKAVVYHLIALKKELLEVYKEFIATCADLSRQHQKIVTNDIPYIFHL